MAFAKKRDVWKNIYRISREPTVLRLLFFKHSQPKLPLLNGIMTRLFSVESNPTDRGRIIVSDAGEVERPRAPGSFSSPSIFNDELVHKFVNIMMYGGQKAVSQKVMKNTFEQIKKKQLQSKLSGAKDVETDPLVVFHKAVENCKPVLGTQTMKKTGKNFQVPYPLPPNRRRFLAIRWLVNAARNRPGNDVPMYEKLSKELLDAYNNTGSVVRKKQDYHKTAETNRAYSHYRWW